jgi:hypothetical protein
LLRWLVTPYAELGRTIIATMVSNAVCRVRENHQSVTSFICDVQHGTAVRCSKSFNKLSNFYHCNVGGGGDPLLLHPIMYEDSVRKRWTSQFCGILEIPDFYFKNLLLPGYRNMKCVLESIFLELISFSHIVHSKRGCKLNQLTAALV